LKVKTLHNAICQVANTHFTPILWNGKLAYLAAKFGRKKRKEKELSKIPQIFTSSRPPSKAREFHTRKNHWKTQTLPDYHKSHNKTI